MNHEETIIPDEPVQVTAEQLAVEPPPDGALDAETARLRAILEAVIYVTNEPLTAAQIADALGEPRDRIARMLEELVAEFGLPQHGLTVREVAGGYNMSTKPEHHDAIRAFVKKLQAPLKLSMAALETLAVVAYKQPVTAPEIMEIRGVQGAGVLKTLLDRKLITTAGRKNVMGRPILYKTTKDFLVQFGLKDLSELPTLKEFEELRSLALGDEPAAEAPAPTAAGPAEPTAAGAQAEPGDEPVPEMELELGPEPASGEPAGEEPAAGESPKPQTEG
jgi:segregation and condensation protein B